MFTLSLSELILFNNILDNYPKY